MGGPDLKYASSLTRVLSISTRSNVMGMGNVELCQFPYSGTLHFYAMLSQAAKIKAFRTRFCG